MSPWNGGTLATAGGLVFQGTADGQLVAYNATSGEKLWDAPLGGGVVAAPMTYEIDGKQYVSIAVGWGAFLEKRTTLPITFLRARFTPSRSAATPNSPTLRVTSLGR